MNWKSRADVVHRTVMCGLPTFYNEIDRRFLSLSLAGEVGELCNLVKKCWQEEYGVAKSQGDKSEAIRMELADVRILLELLAKSYGVDLDRACEDKLTICEARWPEAGAAVRRLGEAPNGDSEEASLTAVIGDGALVFCARCVKCGVVGVSNSERQVVSRCGVHSQANPGHAAVVDGIGFTVGRAT